MMESAPGPETIIDGRRYLYFGGTGYLGLANRPEVIEAACAGMRRYGFHCATSRSGIGTSPLVRDVEELAAEFFGQADSFYFASGYLSNHAMVAGLSQDIELILVDEAAHYSVREAARLPAKPIQTFRHRDANDLAQKAKAGRRVLVMADAVAPATGDVCPIADILGALEGHERAVLLLDDAHGFGVLGDCGSGAVEAAGLWERTNSTIMESGVGIYVCGTLSKALGGFGGIVPGSREFVTRLKQSSHLFSAATAPPSAVAAGTAKALQIVMQEPGLRARLRENVQRIRRGLRSLGLTVPEGATAHVGITTGNAGQMRAVSETLRERGIFLPYISAYTGLPPEGILRFAIFANHTPEQIEHLVSELRSLL